MCYRSHAVLAQGLSPCLEHGRLLYFYVIVAPIETTTQSCHDYSGSDPNSDPSTTRKVGALREKQRKNVKTRRHREEKSCEVLCSTVGVFSVSMVFGFSAKFECSLLGCCLSCVVSIVALWETLYIGKSKLIRRHTEYQTQYSSGAPRKSHRL